jgi:hypothetical protein
MSIVKLQPDQQPPSSTTIPEAIQEPNKSIFTELLPESKIKSLLKYVEGYPWTVNYYGQILNENNTLDNFDPTVPDLTQPYYEVKELILQVSSPLDSSYDQDTGITTISGSAITPYNLKPNVGDVFIASVDSGEDAIFLLNSVERKTFRKDTIYEIRYSLFSYTSQDPSFLTSLYGKVNDTYYFDKDAGVYNRDILIKPSVKEAIDRLNVYLKETKEYYFATFAQKEAGTIYIPGTVSTLYDPLLLEFLVKTIDYSELVDIPFFRHNYSSNKYIEQPSIFTALLSRSVGMLPSINKKFKFVSSISLPNNARLGTLFHTGADYILFPIEPNTDLDIDTISHLDSDPVVGDSPITSKNYFTSAITINTTNNNNIYVKNLLHELFLNDFYVVSENFYLYVDDNTTYDNISYIELLIYKFLKKEPIAKEDLVIAIEKYREFSLLHQLYLLPILWLLIKNNL